jgi:hypothetical protein
MIDKEFVQFCESWIRKADSYSLRSLQGAFDRFFTLFVVYNKLYAESAIRLARAGRILDDEDSYPRDRPSATEYLLMFLQPEEIVRAINLNQDATKAVREITDILEHHRFNIILRGPQGEPQHAQDRQLLDQIKSEDPPRVAAAILRILYAIRCNLFHGHKSYDEDQLQIVAPATILLETVAKALFDKLRDHRAG